MYSTQVQTVHTLLNRVVLLCFKVVLEMDFEGASQISHYVPVVNLIGVGSTLDIHHL